LKTKRKEIADFSLFSRRTNPEFCELIGFEYFSISYGHIESSLDQLIDLAVAYFA
jgi:hypothetical protein